MIVAGLLFAAALGLIGTQRRERIRFLQERLLAERHLRALSSRQEALLASLPEIIMEVDKNKVYIWANQPSLDFFGEDVIGREASHYFEGEQDTYRTVDPLFDGSEDVIFVESWQRRRDGQKRLLAWRCRTIKDPEGNVTSVLSSARDVTDERQAEEARRESDARYRTLVENSPLAILVNREDRIALVNEACLRLFGATSPEQLIGKSLLELFDPDCQETILKRVERLQEFGEVVPMLDEKIIRLDGVPRNVEATAAPFRDKGMIAVHVILNDITERKNTEAEKEAALAALKENEAIFAEFMKNSPVYMFFKDENIRAIRLSANFKDMLGIPAEEALGKNMDELFPSELAKSMIKIDRQILNEGKTVILDEEMNGRYYTTIKFPIRIKGKPCYLAGFTIDITERKLAEERTKAALEAQRTSLREKELLLQEVHHRVKNNLQIISSLLNLEAEGAAPAVREILKRSQTRIRSLSLVHEKLYRSADLTKIDLAGYIETLAVHLFHVYVVDPDKVKLETHFEEVRLDINSAIPCGLILNGLISNALKHAFPGGRQGVITVRLKRTRKDVVEFQVSDNGVGLPDDFDIHKTKSFGFQILNLLVDQLEADLAVDQTRETTFMIRFRELKYKPRI